MPATYSSNLRLELIGPGEQANTWGNTTSNNLGTLMESAVAGRIELSSGWVANSLTLTAFNGANDQSRQMCLVVPAITISADSNIVVPASAVTASSGKLYTVINRSTSYAVTIKLSATTGVTIPANTTKTVIYNGTDFQEAFTALNFLTLTGTPTVNAHAVNKGYVDGKFFINAGANTVTGNTTFTGTVTLPVATPTGNQATSYNYVNSNYLWKAAGESTQTMIPRLKLTQAAVDNDDVITKGYADSNFVGLTTVQTISGTKTFSTNVSLSGSAQLILPNAPLSGTQATNKSYVDGEIAAASSLAASTFVPQTRTITVGTGLQVNGTASADLSGNINLQLVGGGTVTSVTATSPLTATGTTAVNLSMNIASTSQNGYLTSTDWNTFDGKCDANGSNASGTWAISIAGNAATATNATNATNATTATTATNATNAVNATNATNATNAVSATTATNATNANALGGVAASGYVLKTGSTMTGALNVQNSGSPSGYVSVDTVFNGADYFPAVLSVNTAASTYRPIVLAQISTLGTYEVRLAIGTGGAVTISNLAAGGTVSAGAGTGTLTVSSDQNLKIADGFIEDGLSKIDALQPRYFYWKDEEGNANLEEGRQLGFYAQEVQAVSQEASPTGQGIYDRAIIAMLVKAVQELKTEVEALKGA